MKDRCKISLDSDDNNCGSCGSVCSLPHAHAICIGQNGNGKCGPEYCTDGWTNENGLDEDGCEVPPK